MTGAVIRNPDRELQLQEHIRQTFPSSLDSWLGKEHFWSLGDKTDINRRTAGTLFMELCFPIKEKVGWHKTAETVDPAELGLNLSTRLEVGISYPPVELATMSTSERAYAHFGFRTEKGFWRNTQPLADTVIGVASLLDLATNPEAPTKKAHFSNAALDALVAFGGVLIDLPSK